MKITPLFAATCMALTAFLTPAMAEHPDRQQPINIESDRATVDDRNKVHIFEGNAILTQGSLRLRGERLVVTEGADGFHTGVATAPAGGLATFRQLREGTDNEYVEGEAVRIEYDTRTEQAKLFERAMVTSAGDIVTGDYIEYDALTENYAATRLAPKDGTAPSRVNVTIQPR